MSLPNSHLGNLTCHLNAPYREVVQEDHLARALREGSTASIPDETERAVILSVFVEASPAMILSGAREAGGSWREAASLYRESIAEGSPRIATWEATIEAWK